MNKVLMLLMFGAFILTGSVYAQTPPPAVVAAPSGAPVVAVHHEHHKLIHAAINKLKEVRHELERAAHDYGGHKAKAIAAVDEALAELHSALDFDK